MNSDRRSFLTGLGGFILAGIVSNLAVFLIFASGLLSFLIRLVPEEQPLVRLLTGVILVFVGIGLGGAIGGLVRGYFLHRIDPQASQRRYLAGGAFAGGISYGILVIPTLLFISLVSMYNVGAQTDPASFVVLFALIGGVFGLLNGLILALLTVRLRYVWLPWGANLLGSLIGGALIGLLIWRPEWLAASSSKILDGALFLVVAGILINAFAGGMLGLAYDWLARKRQVLGEKAVAPRRWQDIVTVSAGALILLMVMSFTNQIASFITIYPGSTSTSLDSLTEGIHWRNAETVASLQANPGDTTPGLAADSAGPVLVWSEGGDQTGEIFYTAHQGGGETATWSTPLNVSHSPQVGSNHPQVAIGPDGAANIIWAEGGKIMFSRCQEATCSASIEFSTPIESCGAKSGTLQNDWPAIAVTPTGTVIAAWSAGQDGMAFTTWQAAQAPGSGGSGCLTQDGLVNPQPRLAASQTERITLVAAAPPASPDGPVAWASFENGGWSALETVGQGSAANITNDMDGRAHLAWCRADGKLEVLPEGAAIERLDVGGCSERPALVQDSLRRMHLIYAAGQLSNNFGVAQSFPSLAEMIKLETGWSQPAIVALTDSMRGLSAARGPGGELHLSWSGMQNSAPGIAYTMQPTYECDSSGLAPAARAMLDVIESGAFHPQDYQSPFCANRFDGLIYMPRPEAEIETLPANQDNGFDQTAVMLREVQHEVLFSNMQWDPDIDELSPGFRISEAVANLYKKLKANPEAFPRGITVRILLGNYPNLATLEYGDQIWGLVHDLTQAGVETFEDPAIGWKLEIANYAGSFPHSHTKFMVIDGRTLLSAGFNISWYHLPKDDPSKKGDDLADLGLVLTGPVAQTGMMVFDDMWDGANQLACTDLSAEDIQDHCTWEKASVSHAPEVLRYYLAESDQAAFAIFRTADYKEADQAYVAAIKSAQSSIDAMHVNFSAELICMVNLVMPGVCDFTNALPYMVALVDAAEQNGTHIRIIVENANSNGLENRVGIQILQDELERRGISDRVEVRFFNGRLHAKSALIDRQLLMIGSQNFHYSSFSPGGLLEFGAATTDPQAIETYQKMFDQHWQQAIPAEQAIWGSSGN